MKLLDAVLNNELKKPFSSPPPPQAMKSALNTQDYPSEFPEDEASANDYVLPILQSKQVVSGLYITFWDLS